MTAARAMPLRRATAVRGVRCGAAGGGGEVADGSMGRGAEGGRGPVGARAPTEGDADANCSAAVVGSSAESAPAGV